MKRLWNNLRTLCQAQSGQGIVELALAIPLVLTLLCGMLELGWVCSNKLLLDNICRESTRYGITYAADSAENLAMVRSRVAALADSSLNSSLEVRVTYDNPADHRSGDLSVTLDYDLPTLTPVVGIFAGDTIRLASSCRMKMG